MRHIQNHILNVGWQHEEVSGTKPKLIAKAIYKPEKNKD